MVLFKETNVEQIRRNELKNLILHDDDQLCEGTGKISSYFTDEPLCDYIHIIAKPPLSPFKIDFVRNMLLSEGDIVEYLDKDCIHKATLWEVREKLNKLYFEQEEEDEAHWNEVLLNYLYQEMMSWTYFRAETFSLVKQHGVFTWLLIPPNVCDPLPICENVSQDLQKAFDEALKNELGPPFREMHYNLVGMNSWVSGRCCSYSLGENQCKSYQNDVVRLGSRIGVIAPQRTSGTLRSGTDVTIHQPSHEDLDELIQTFDDLADNDKNLKGLSEAMCKTIEAQKQKTTLQT
ncbi:6726_t:CDS:2 [Diversispora eburnea]|uniref:6726_t:CDS:1 n=1 Tax=Diversispora eburnea TaxID=1213867 RepID=A0A9N8YUQ3_9GLOM|nr:6726_t:CDS:2 [Diversispora eburnea]